MRLYYNDDCGLETFAFIVREASKFYGVRTNKVYGVSRHSEVCKARRLSMLIAYVHLNLSASQIGRLLNRCHTTVLHGIELAKSDSSVLKACDTIFALVELVKTPTNSTD